MSYSNRELVEFYISYKLFKMNHPTSLLWKDGESSPSASTATGANGMLVRGNSKAGASTGAGGIEAVKRALQESADEFEQLFTQAFSDISSQLEITSDTAYDSFKRVMDEVFKDGVNWGRVVGLFAFGGVLCVECAEKGLGGLVPQIADWMTKYLDENISPWIQSQGGWVSDQQETLLPFFQAFHCVSINLDCNSEEKKERNSLLVVDFSFVITAAPDFMLNNFEVLDAAGE